LEILLGLTMSILDFQEHKNLFNYLSFSNF
jgi:hypothetical protein